MGLYTCLDGILCLKILTNANKKTFFKTSRRFKSKNAEEDKTLLVRTKNVL